MGKRPLPTILYTSLDTFRMFGPANEGSCVNDVNNTFEEVITLIEGRISNYIACIIK